MERFEVGVCKAFVDHFRLPSSDGLGFDLLNVHPAEVGDKMLVKLRYLTVICRNFKSGLAVFKIQLRQVTESQVLVGVSPVEVAALVFFSFSLSFEAAFLVALMIAVPVRVAALHEPGVICVLVNGHDVHSSLEIRSE